MKKRILFASEASFLNSGYSTYYKEVMTRIINNYGDRFEIAELASYANPNDQRCIAQMNQTPWRVYPVMPHDDDKEYQNIYNQDPINQFGKAAFERVALDFQPDVCGAIRDFWYDQFLIYSPYRKLYNLILMPTTDAFPLNEEWVQGFRLTDGCFTYTDWAERVFNYQAGNKINLLGTAAPGADTETFFPIPQKAQLKQSIGLRPDALVFGMVARNQMRKLFPDLMEAFARFLIEGPKDITSRTIFYLHTAWPDLGWDIPLLLKEFGLGNKVMFTYICRNPECNNVFGSFFQDCKGFCNKCSQPSATLTNSNAGVPNQILNSIYNVMDVYCQISSMAGLEMPAVEAAAAGLPVMCLNYAGMEDIVDKVEAIPVNVSKFNREVTTGRYMASPDLDDFILKLTELLSVPESIRRSYGYKSRELVKEHFNWDKTTKKWVDAFDSMPAKDWKSPVRIHQPNTNVPNNLNNEQFVNWCLVNVAGQPELVNSYMALRCIRDLNWGHYAPGNTMGGLYFSEENVFAMKPQFEEFNRDKAMREFLKINEVYNGWEMQRKNKFNL